MSTEKSTPTGVAGPTEVEASLAICTQPSGTYDEKLGPCFEFEFVFVERDTDTGNPTNRISTRVRVPVEPLVDVATRAAEIVGPKEAEIMIAAHIHKVEHLCYDAQCTHSGPVDVTHEYPSQDHSGGALGLLEKAYPETKEL